MPTPALLGLASLVISVLLLKRPDQVRAAIAHLDLALLYKGIRSAVPVLNGSRRCCRTFTWCGQPSSGSRCLIPGCCSGALLRCCIRDEHQLASAEVVGIQLLQALSDLLGVVAVDGLIEEVELITPAHEVLGHAVAHVQIDPNPNSVVHWAVAVQGCGQTPIEVEHDARFTKNASRYA